MTHNQNHLPHSNPDEIKVDIDQVPGVTEMIPVKIESQKMMGKSALDSAEVYPVTSVEYPNEAGGALVMPNGNHAAEFDGRDTAEEDDNEQQAA